MQIAIKKVLTALSLSVLIVQALGVSAKTGGESGPATTENTAAKVAESAKHRLGVSEGAKKGRIEDGIIIGKISDLTKNGYLSGSSVTIESPYGYKRTFSVNAEMYNHLEKIQANDKNQDDQVFSFERHTLTGDIAHEGTVSFIPFVFNPFTTESYSLYNYSSELTGVLPKKSFKKSQSYKKFQDNPVQDNGLDVAYTYHFTGDLVGVQHHNGTFRDYGTCQASLIDSDKVMRYFTTETTEICDYLFDSIKTRQKVTIKAVPGQVLSERYVHTQIVIIQPASTDINAEPVTNDEKPRNTKVESEQTPPSGVAYSAAQMTAGVVKGGASFIYNLPANGYSTAGSVVNSATATAKVPVKGAANIASKGISLMTSSKTEKVDDPAAKKEEEKAETTETATQESVPAAPVASPTETTSEASAPAVKDGEKESIRVNTPPKWRQNK